MATERKFEGDAYAVFKDDFFNFTAADWTITTAEVGSGSASEAITAGPGGVLLLTNAAGDNDHDFLQGNECFLFTTGKRLAFKARFKVSDATESDLVMGLMITDTTPLATVTDGIYFQKDDGDANLDLHVTKDSTASSATAVAVLEDDTWTTVEFYYDGSDDNIDYYINGVLTGTLALTNTPDDEELAVTFGIQNGEAVAKTMSIDYIQVAQER